jgi:hypothetical protein
MEGRGGLAMATGGGQAAGAAAAHASRPVPEPGNWMKQQQPHVLATSDSKAAFFAKGIQKAKQPYLPQQQHLQPSPIASPVNHLFGSDGCLRSHLVQEVLLPY